MKLVLSKNVIGINRSTGVERLYAENGDVLPIVAKDKQNTIPFYWCFVNGSFIPVMESQVLTTIEDKDDKSNNYEETPMESLLSDLE